MEIVIILVIAAALIAGAIVLFGRKAQTNVEAEMGGESAPASETGAGVEDAVRGATPYMPQSEAAAPHGHEREDPGLPPASENPGLDTPDDGKPASDADKL